MPKVEEDKFSPIKSIKYHGNIEYFINLIKLYKTRKFPKVLLLTGEKGLGKFTLAFHLINFFFTNNDRENSYDLKNLTININNNFYKKILLNVNENFNYIGKQEGKNVTVDTIRELKKKYNTSSLNNLPRFTILDDADQLNASSANALLKLIEEPSDLNYFILINNKRKKIMDTLKSRSLEVKIFLKKKEKEGVLNNLIKNYDVNCENFSNFVEKTTPGILIRVCECLQKLKIKEPVFLHKNIEILLDKFKKDKNDIYLETVKFLLDFEIYQIVKNNEINIMKLGLIKNKIIKLLFEYENFNLSKNIILESFKSLPKYA